MNGDRLLQFNYEISTTWETKLTTSPQKTSRILMGTEQVTRPKNLKAIPTEAWYVSFKLVIQF